MKTTRKVTESIVAIAGDKNSEGENLVDALNMLPTDKIIGREDTVVITPNWVKSEPPQMGTVVGPETLRQLIRYVKEFSPSRIVIATGSGGGDTPTVMKEQGFDKIIQEEGVQFVDLNFGPYVEIQLDHHSPSSTPVNKILDELTVLISFTQLKVHREATITAAIKNIALGWPPSEIHGTPKMSMGIHNDLHGFIYAMCKKIPIDISIVSTDKAMVGTGPSGGKPVAGGMVIAGTDPVSVDTVGAHLLGFFPPAVNYLFRLINDNIGQGDFNNIQFKGIPLDTAVERFSMAAYGHSIKVK